MMLKVSRAELESPSSGFNVVSTTSYSQLATLTLEPEETRGGPDNYHSGNDQWIYVTSGYCTVVIEDYRVSVDEGDLLLIESGQTHHVINEGTSRLVAFYIYTPSVH